MHLILYKAKLLTTPWTLTLVFELISRWEKVILRENLTHEKQSLIILQDLNKFTSFFANIKSILRMWCNCKIYFLTKKLRLDEASFSTKVNDSSMKCKMVHVNSHF